MRSGPSDSTLFFKILIFCSHDIPLGDSCWGPNLAVCWQWARPLGDKTSVPKAPMQCCWYLATSPGILLFCAHHSCSGRIEFLGAQNIKVPGDVAKLKYYMIRVKCASNSSPNSVATTSRLPNLDHSGNLRWECRVNIKLMFWKIKWNKRVLTSARYRISIFYPIWTRISGRKKSYTVTGNTRTASPLFFKTSKK